MSLLHEQDYVISHLRNAYLRSYQDGIGERVIKPSHLYITKTGPKELNWAASSLLSLANPSSPPIPVDSFNERIVEFQRAKNNQGFSASVGGTSTITRKPSQHRRERSIKRRGRSATLPLFLESTVLEVEGEDNFSNTGMLLNISEQTAGQPPNAQLPRSKTNAEHDAEEPDIVSQSISQKKTSAASEKLTMLNRRGRSTDDLLGRAPTGLDKSEISANFDTDDGDMESESVFGEDDTIGDEDDDDDSDDIGISSDSDTDSLYTDFEEENLVALSAEDDSAIEEDLEFATRQIKAQAHAHGDLDSAVSSVSNSITAHHPHAHRRTMGTSSNSSSVSGILAPPISRSYLRRNTGASDTNSAVGAASAAAQQRRMSVPSRPRNKTNDSLQSRTESSGGPITKERSSSTVASVSAATFLNEAENTDNAGNYSENAGNGSHRRQIDVAPSISEKSEPFIIPENSPPEEIQLQKNAAPRRRSSSTLSVSKLSSLIKIKQSSFDNPLEQYISASGRSEQRPLKIKMYMPSCDEPKTPWTVVVRHDINVANAIGFALYCYMEARREPPLEDVLCDANQWNLRIVEDDGEPDEDFPALDRTRMISAYAFDEFALVKATPAQIKENERITPNSKKPTKAKPQELLNLARSEAKRSSEEPFVSVSVFQFPFNETLSQEIFSATRLPASTSIGALLDMICKDRALDPTQYFLKATGSRSVLSPDAPISSVQNTMFELTPRRVVTMINGYSADDLITVKSIADRPLRSSVNGKGLPKARSATTLVPGGKSTSTLVSSGSGHSKSNGNSSTPISASFSVAGSISSSLTSRPRRNSANNMYSTFGVRNNTSSGGAGGAGAAGQSRMSVLVNKDMLPGALAAGYEKYTVWRRQPMSFISRHERVLAIDGEYIHIMPSEEKTWLDSPKTSSFHISQIIKCKQSSKIPANFKIVIMKTSGAKRYDLEAPSASISAEIVARVKFLCANYKSDFNHVM